MLWSVSWSDWAARIPVAASMIASRPATTRPVGASAGASETTVIDGCDTVVIAPVFGCLGTVLEPKGPLLDTSAVCGWSRLVATEHAVQVASEPRAVVRRHARDQGLKRVHHLGMNAVGHRRARGGEEHV